MTTQLDRKAFARVAAESLRFGLRASNRVRWLLELRDLEVEGLSAEPLAAVQDRAAGFARRGPVNSATLPEAASREALLRAQRWLGGLLRGFYEGSAPDVATVPIPGTLALQDGVVVETLFTWELPWFDGFQHEARTALRELWRERYRLRFCRNPRCRMAGEQPGLPTAFITKRRQVFCSEACAAATRAREYRGRRAKNVTRRRAGTRRHDAAGTSRA